MVRNNQEEVWDHETLAAAAALPPLTISSARLVVGPDRSVYAYSPGASADPNPRVLARRPGSDRFVAGSDLGSGVAVATTLPDGRLLAYTVSLTANSRIGFHFLDADAQARASIINTGPTSPAGDRNFAALDGLVADADGAVYLATVMSGTGANAGRRQIRKYRTLGDTITFEGTLIDAPSGAERIGALDLLPDGRLLYAAGGSLRTLATDGSGERGFYEVSGTVTRVAVDRKAGVVYAHGGGAVYALQYPEGRLLATRSVGAANLSGLAVQRP